MMKSTDTGLGELNIDVLVGYELKDKTIDKNTVADKVYSVWGGMIKSIPNTVDTFVRCCQYEQFCVHVALSRRQLA